MVSEIARPLQSSAETCYLSRLGDSALTGSGHTAGSTPSHAHEMLTTGMDIGRVIMRVKLVAQRSIGE